MKYPPRSQQHPEIMSAGIYGPPLYAALRAQFREGELRSSGQIQGLLEALGDGFDTAQGAMCFSIMAWQDNGKAVYFLEEGLAETLTHTEMPMSSFDLPAWIPDNGMYVALPPLFDIENPDTSRHLVEGFYLVKDLIAVPLGADGKPDFHTTAHLKNGKHTVVSDADGYQPIQGITCVGVGRPKGFRWNLKEMRDDALVVFHLCPGTPLGEGTKRAFGGIAELERVVVNLLYAMRNTTSVVVERRQPEMGEKMSKRRPAKAKKLLEEGGKTLDAYTVLSLSKTVRSARPAEGREESAAPERKLKHPKYISGHFHRYWVKDAAKERVLETKDGKGGKLYLVEYLLAPYLQGADLPKPPTKTVIVRA
jgi:hypothetical protein